MSSTSSATPKSRCERDASEIRPANSFSVSETVGCNFLARIASACIVIMALTRRRASSGEALLGVATYVIITSSLVTSSLEACICADTRTIGGV